MKTASPQALPMPQRLIASSLIIALLDFNFKRFFGHVRIKTGQKIFIHGSVLLKAKCLTQKDGKPHVNTELLTQLHATVTRTDKGISIDNLSRTPVYRDTLTAAHIESVAQASSMGSELDAVQQETLRLMSEHHDRVYRDSARQILIRHEQNNHNRINQLSAFKVLDSVKTGITKLDGDLKLASLLTAMQNRFRSDAEAFETAHGLTPKASFQDRMMAALGIEILELVPAV